jgi:hypothetical protein
MPLIIGRFRPVQYLKSILSHLLTIDNAAGPYALDALQPGTMPSSIEVTAGRPERLIVTYD